MRVAPPINLSEQQREELESNSRGRSIPARVVERSRIVLLAAAGKQDREIAAALSMTRKKASRWRKRFLRHGLAGLYEDAPRPGRRPTISPDRVSEIVRRTTQENPAEASHWSTRLMAAAAGVSEASVRRIWHAHGLKPHLVKGFKLSNDPQLAEKLEDIIGLYLNPPEHALVLLYDALH